MATYHQMVVTPIVSNIQTESPPSGSARFIFPAQQPVVQLQSVSPEIVRRPLAQTEISSTYYYPSQRLSQVSGVTGPQQPQRITTSERASWHTFGRSSRSTDAQPQTQLVQVHNPVPLVRPVFAPSIVSVGSNPQPINQVLRVVQSSTSVGPKSWTGYYRPVEQTLDPNFGFLDYVGLTEKHQHEHAKLKLQQSPASNGPRGTFLRRSKPNKLLAPPRDLNTPKALNIPVPTPKSTQRTDQRNEPEVLNPASQVSNRESNLPVSVGVPSIQTPTQNAKKRSVPVVKVDLEAYTRNNRKKENPPAANVQVKVSVNTNSSGKLSGAKKATAAKADRHTNIPVLRSSREIKLPTESSKDGDNSSKKSLDKKQDRLLDLQIGREVAVKSSASKRNSVDPSNPVERRQTGTSHQTRLFFGDPKDAQKKSDHQVAAAKSAGERVREILESQDQQSQFGQDFFQMMHHILKDWVHVMETFTLAQEQKRHSGDSPRSNLHPSNLQQRILDTQSTILNTIRTLQTSEDGSERALLPRSAGQIPAASLSPNSLGWNWRGQQANRNLLASSNPANTLHNRRLAEAVYRQTKEMEQYLKSSSIGALPDQQGTRSRPLRNNNLSILREAGGLLQKGAPQVQSVGILSPVRGEVEFRGLRSNDSPLTQRRTSNYQTENRSKDPRELLETTSRSTARKPQQQATSNVKLIKRKNLMESPDFPF